MMKRGNPILFLVWGYWFLHGAESIFAAAASVSPNGKKTQGLFAWVSSHSRSLRNEIAKKINFMPEISLRQPKCKFKTKHSYLRLLFDLKDCCYTNTVRVLFITMIIKKVLIWSVDIRVTFRTQCNFDQVLLSLSLSRWRTWRCRRSPAAGSGSRPRWGSGRKGCWEAQIWKGLFRKWATTTTTGFRRRK